MYISKFKHKYTNPLPAANVTTYHWVNMPIYIQQAFGIGLANMIASLIKYMVIHRTRISLSTSTFASCFNTSSINNSRYMNPYDIAILCGKIFFYEHYTIALISISFSVKFQFRLVAIYIYRNISLKYINWIVISFQSSTIFT